MSTSAALLLRKLHAHSLRIFTTTDVTILTGMQPSAVTHALRRLAAQGLLIKIRRGIWKNNLVPHISPYEMVPFLTAPWPSYVSLYSALAEWGVVEEVPQVIYAVSPGRPQLNKTNAGEFRIHHLPDRLIWGYEMKRVGGGSYPIAEPEKAFLDLAYLALVPRSPLGFPYKRDNRWRFDFTKLRRYAKRYGFPPLLKFLREKRLLRDV